MENRHNEKGCLMAYIAPTYGSRIVSMTKKLVPSKNLYIDPNDSTYGYEENPHVTIKYGFEPDLKQSDVYKILNGISTFFVKLDSLDKFNTNPNYDVAKFNVENNDVLTELRKRCDGYPNADEYPIYKPHITLAYVKKNLFPHKRSKLDILFPVTKFKYSGPIGEYFINLK